MRKTLPALAAGLLGSATSACAPDTVESEKRPPEDEVREFYETFCVRWEECEPDVFPSLAACADEQVDHYGTRPTGCLNRIMDYHQCMIEQECRVIENPSVDRSCTELKEAVRAVDCGEEFLNL